MRGGWRTAAFGAAVGVVVTTLAGGVWLSDRLTPNPMSGSLPPQPVIVPISVTHRVASSPVTLKVVPDAARPVVVGRGGTLTTLATHPGSTVRDGQLLARVDNFPVIAMAAPRPLYRDLATGSRGRDVQDLTKWLRGQGSTAKVSSRYDWRTREAVRRWQRSVGLPVTGRFTREQVAWIGPSGGLVASIDTSPGSMVANGQKLVTLQASARMIRVQEPAGGVAKGASVLEVAGTQVDYVPGSGSISERKAVRKIAAMLGGKDEGAGRVVTREGTDVAVVPSGALVTDESGKTCVFPGPTADPTPVTAIGGGLGGVDIEPVPTLTEVLANPAEVRTALRCA